MQKASAIAGGGLWVLALSFGLGSAAWPEYVKPHPNIVIALFVIGALMVLAPAVQRFFPVFREEGERPRIMLTAQDREPFRLVHLGGGAAQHIQVEPIQSALGKNIWVRFGAVDFLSGAKPEVYPSFRLYIHGIAKGNSDMGLLGAGLFSGDAVGRSTVDYPITISFHWNGKRLKERQTLTWHYATKTLTSGSAK